LDVDQILVVITGIVEVKKNKCVPDEMSVTKGVMQQTQRGFITL
jgi:hypothetical protein